MNRKCKLCGKTFSNNNYKLFGTSCFKKVCEISGIKIPKNIMDKDREKYLCSVIAKRLNKKRLTTKQKQYLAELYLVTLYIDKIEYVNLDRLKKKIQKQIDNINFFTGVLLPNEYLSMVLYSIYSLYNATEKFKENLSEIENIKANNKEQQNSKNDKIAINYFQYIFRVKKILTPKEYTLGYYRQYIFWNAVINGGILFNYKLAAKLLKHSLSEIGEKTITYNVTDSCIIEDIKKDVDFKEKINEILEKHIDETYFKTNVDDDKETIAFENNTDMKYAIHNANMIVEGTKKNDNNWDLNIEILDRFDFTDFVFPEEYNDKYKEINEDERKKLKQKAVSSAKNGIGYTLNNMALISVQYGVLKEYDVKIEFDIKNYGKEGD